MSLRAELETWAAALKAYEEEDFEKALDLFGRIADTSKINTNIGLIYATLGEHEEAVNYFNRATELDKYLAVAYFQCGVSNFLLGRYELAKEDFFEALRYLRDNQAINYEQLGLKFRLYSAEVLFNKGLCLIYMGNTEEGLEDMKAAQREKATDEHNVIDEAIADSGDGYTVFSIPVGVLYRPPENKLKNAKPKDYLGRAKLVAVDNPNDAYTTFTGSTRMQQGFTPTGTPLDRPPQEKPGDSSLSLEGPGVGRAQTAMARLERKPTTLQLGGLAAERAAGGAGGSLSPGGAAAGGAGLQKAATIGARPTNGGANVLPGTKGPQRGMSVRRVEGASPQPGTPPSAGERRGVSPGPGTLAPPGGGRSGGNSRLTEFYDDYLDGYGEEQPMPDDAKRVAAWASKTQPGPPNGVPSRSPSTRPPPSAFGGSNSMRRRPTRRNTYRSRAATSQYGDEEGSDFEDMPFDLVKIKIKIHYSGDVRGMAITPDMPFDEFMERLGEKFSINANTMSLKFQDEDGAKVSLRDESDFDMAVETARASANGKPDGKLVIWIE